MCKKSSLKWEGEDRGIGCNCVLQIGRSVAAGKTSHRKHPTLPYPEMATLYTHLYMFLKI